MKTSILNAIPIDIVEIIIVKSDNYDLFLKLQDFLVKLKENSRVSRIKDKLTNRTLRDYIISYSLDNKYYREYDKPSQIYINIPCYSYRSSMLNRANNNPSYIYFHKRYWYKNYIKHRDHDLPGGITYNGKQGWLINDVFGRKNNLPVLVKRNGFRYFMPNLRCVTVIFDYL